MSLDHGEINFTDRQTDRRHAIAIPRFALYRAVKTHYCAISFLPLFIAIVCIL